MRSAGGHYHGGDSSDVSNPNVYAAEPSPVQQQPQYNKGEHHQNHNQWRWERDGSKIPSPVSPSMFNEAPESEASRPYYQSQRPEPRMGQDRQGSHDSRSQSRGEEMGMRYGENFMLQSVEGLEQKFLDDIMKLSKEQNDAEDAENARHRERINIINVQYQEQLVALRARHASRREELFRRESNFRQQQYQQDHYPTSGREPPRQYITNSHNEHTRFHGSGRNNEFEPRAQYPSGRVYDTSPRYY